MRSANERKLRQARAGKVRAGKVRARGVDPGQSTEKSDGVLYLQILRSLKDEIVKGIYPVGSQLPTEEELCERFSVSRYTVREALRRLREDRLVASRRGAGTVVLPPSSPDSYVHEVTSFNDLITFATGVRFAIDTMEIISADAKLAARIGGSAGDRWLAVRGFRYTEKSDLPVCWTEVYIDAEFAAIGRLLQRNTGPIFHLIEDMFGQPIVEVHQEISAGTVPPGLATGLKAKSGAMALLVQRTYRLASGRIAQVAVNTHPASRFRHAMTMRRVKG
jgi:DNA-binding GntR family transcriptional regulator